MEHASRSLLWGAAALLLAFSSSVAVADAPADLHLAVNSATAVLTFKGATTFFDFTGRASGVIGTLTLVHDRPVAGRVEFPVAELKTGDGGRDRDMLASKYLDGEHDRSIDLTFASLDGPPPSADRQSGTLHAFLHVKDSRLPVTASVAYAWHGDTLEVEGGFPVDIRALGMTPPSVMIVQRMDPIIHIAFALSFQPAASPRAASP